MQTRVVRFAERPSSRFCSRSPAQVRDGWLCQVHDSAPVLGPARAPSRRGAAAPVGPVRAPIGSIPAVEWAVSLIRPVGRRRARAAARWAAPGIPAGPRAPVRAERLAPAGRPRRAANQLGAATAARPTTPQPTAGVGQQEPTVGRARRPSAAVPRRRIAAGGRRLSAEPPHPTGVAVRRRLMVRAAGPRHRLGATGSRARPRASARRSRRPACRRFRRTRT